MAIYRKIYVKNQWAGEGDKEFYLRATSENKITFLEFFFSWGGIRKTLEFEIHGALEKINVKEIMKEVPEFKQFEGIEKNNMEEALKNFADLDWELNEIMSEQTMKREIAGWIRELKYGVKTDEKKLTPKEKYSEYRQTSRWKELAQRCKNNAKHRCQICYSSSNLNAHHRSYDRKGTNEEIDDLICLCRKCHNLFHSSDSMMSRSD